jgi:dTDP-4-amino-4,6-dideoxy-D-galactose acyltransferase
MPGWFTLPARAPSTVFENYRLRDRSDAPRIPRRSPSEWVRQPAAARIVAPHFAPAFAVPALAPAPAPRRAPLGRAGSILERTLKFLDWDSRHFGFPVARITAPDLDDGALAKVLHAARRNSAVLVYWTTRSKRPVSAALLREFSGTQVDRRATFVAELPAAVPTIAGGGPASFRLWEYPKGPASEPLVALAIGAGILSRFNVDPRFPRDKFESLYATWIKRSTRGELADAVWVASPSGEDAALVGMVTVSVSGGAGQINLISVACNARGRGVGRLLMECAHYWLIGRGATRASVVTQLANRPACRLYERAGYTLRDVERCFHFWPQDRRLL